MAIHVACSCGARFLVQDDWAGRRAKCRSCGAVVTIPLPGSVDPLANQSTEGSHNLAGQAAAPPPTGGFSDLYNEQYPATATSAASLPGQTGASRISVESDVQIPNEQDAIDVIERNFRRHFLLAEDGTYSRVDLKIQILEWVDEGLDKALTLSVYGQVNGRTISKRFSKDYSTRIVYGSVLFTVAMSKLWDGIVNRIRGVRISQQMRKCIEDTIDEACMKADKIGGVRPPASAKLWNLFNIANISLTAAAILIALLVLTVKWGQWDRKFLLYFFVAAAAGMFTFIPLHVIQLFSMPESFYTRDPRGRRILARWMAKSTAALKIRIVTMIVIVIAAYIGFHIWGMAMLRDGPGGRGRPAQAAKADPPEPAPPKADPPRRQIPTQPAPRDARQERKENQAHDPQPPSRPRHQGFNQSDLKDHNSPPDPEPQDATPDIANPFTPVPSPTVDASRSPFGPPSQLGRSIGPPAGFAPSRPSARPPKRDELIGGSGGMPVEIKRDELVVGARIREGSWAGKTALGLLDPIFEHTPQTSDELAAAKEGYAVGGLVVDAGDFVHGVRLIFMRITPDRRLDPQDSYNSPWLGAPAGNSPVEIKSDGRPVVGFKLRRAAVVDAVGLVYE